MEILLKWDNVSHNQMVLFSTFQFGGGNPSINALTGIQMELFQIVGQDS